MERVAAGRAGGGRTRSRPRSRSRASSAVPRRGPGGAGREPGAYCLSGKVMNAYTLSRARRLQPIPPIRTGLRLPRPPRVSRPDACCAPGTAVRAHRERASCPSPSSSCACASPAGSESSESSATAAGPRGRQHGRGAEHRPYALRPGVPLSLRGGVRACGQREVRHAPWPSRCERQNALRGSQLAALCAS